MAWHWWWPWGQDAVAEGEERWRRTGGGQRGHGFWDGPVDPEDLVWFPGREVCGEPARGGRPAGVVSPDVPYVVADGVPLDVYRAALEASTGQCGACWGTGAAEDQLDVGDLGVIPCERCDGTGLWQGGLPDPEVVSDAEAAALAEQTLAEEWPAEDDDEDEGEDGDADARVEGDEAEDESESEDEADDAESEDDVGAEDGAQGDDAEGDDVGSVADSGDARGGEADGGGDDGGWGDDGAYDGDSADAGDGGGDDGPGGSEGGDASGGGGPDSGASGF